MLRGFVSFFFSFNVKHFGLHFTRMKGAIYIKLI